MKHLLCFVLCSCLWYHRLCSARLSSTINGTKICHWLHNIYGHSNLWNSYQKSNIPLVFHPLLHVSICICLGAPAKSGRKWCRDKSVIGWLGGEAMATGVVDVFLRVNILSVSPCCLPAPLRSTFCLCVCVCVCVWGRDIKSVLVEFVCICFTCGAGWVQYCQQMQVQIPRIRCWSQITELKNDYE